MNEQIGIFLKFLLFNHQLYKVFVSFEIKIIVLLHGHRAQVVNLPPAKDSLEKFKTVFQLSPLCLVGIVLRKTIFKQYFLYYYLYNYHPPPVKRGVNGLLFNKQLSFLYENRHSVKFSGTCLVGLDKNDIYQLLMIFSLFVASFYLYSWNI